MIALVLICIVAVGYFVFKTEEKIRHNKIIKVSGNIEAYDTRLSFRVQGQIEELLVDEGYVVKVGDIVAKLNTDELSKIQAEAAASLKAAEYQLALDALDYERAENLYQEGAISAQQRDSAKTLAESDQANVEQLKASLDLANTRLGFTNLASPKNSYILVKSAEAGEVVQIGQTVFTVADLNDIWLTAYVNETDLARVKYNQEAYVMTDTYPGKKYNGRISFISSEAEFTPKQIQTTEERVKLVYRIKIKIDNSSLDLKPGMPADGYIIE
jgi:HlyD family secretion protein